MSNQPKKYFSASQVARLVDSDPNIIGRWARLGLIENVPIEQLGGEGSRFKCGGRTTIVYTFVSIIQCKILKNITLQANIHGGTVKKVLEFLKTLGEEPNLKDLCLARFNNTLLWVKQDQFGELMRAIIVAGTKRGQYLFTPLVMLDDALSDLKQNVIRSDIDEDNKVKFIQYIDSVRKAA